MNDHILESSALVQDSTPAAVVPRLITFIFLFSMIGCEGDSTLSPYCTDPLGSDNKSYKNGNIFCYKESYNGCFTLEMTTANPIIRVVNYTGKELAMIIDIGAVKCLSEVKIKPASGYVYALNAVLGHGYVIKLPDGTYGRFFIDSWLKSNTNVVVEMNITRQYSF